jgi:hypothetical protein
MQNDHSDRIRQRAQEIWEQEGRPEGRAEDHWARAERELGPSAAGSLAKAAGQPKAAGPKKAANGATKPSAAKAAESNKRRGSATAPQG